MSDPTEATILLAEEHDATRSFLQDNLSADGYRVLVAADRAKALALLSTAHPDLIVVDINGQTLELIDAVRSGEGIAGRADPETPMIVLSRDADRLQRIRLLERGGDDVVKKPFAYPELRARIGAVLRRSQTSRRGRRMLRAGPVVIDVPSREVRVGERAVELSATEYQLLLALAGEPHRVFTREELLRSVWGLDTFGRTRTLDTHVISSPDMAVVYVDCGFCPTRGRRFISSGVVSALAAGLSPEGEAPWRGRCAPADHTPQLTRSWLPRTSPIASRCRTGGRRGRCSAPTAGRSSRWRGSCGICTESSARPTRSARMRMI